MQQRFALLVVAAIFCGLGEIHLVLAQAPQRPRAAVTFSGRLEAGQRFVRRVGPDFEFILDPEPRDAAGASAGWDIVIERANTRGNLARWTPPLSGPRQMYLYASYFLPDANAPGRKRFLIFSPEVGDAITEDTFYQAAAKEDSAALKRVLERISEFGQVELTVRNYQLNGRTSSEDVGFLWIQFDVRVSWPKSYTPGQAVGRR